MKYLFPIIITLLASPVYAQSWTLNCNSNIDNRKSMRVGQAVCFDPDENTDDSPIIDVSGCGYTNWSYFEDKDGDSTDCAVDFTIQGCPDATLTGSAATAGCEDLEGVSDLSATNRFESGIASGPWLRLDSAGSGANAGDCRVIVTCANGSGGL